MQQKDLMWIGHDAVICTWGIMRTHHIANNVAEDDDERAHCGIRSRILHDLKIWGERGM